LGRSDEEDLVNLASCWICQVKERVIGKETLDICLTKRRCRHISDIPDWRYGTDAWWI